MRFRPPLWGIALMLLGVLVFGSAGVWQWQRAQYKERLFDAYARAASAAPVALDQALARIEETRFERVTVTGHYRTPQLLLDHQIQDHRRGVQVVTPFVLADRDAVLLVLRGFLPWTDRTREPDVAVDPGPRHLQGWLSPPPRPGLRLGGATFERLPGGHLLLTALVPAELERALATPLLPYVLLLDPVSPDGYERHWRPQTLPPERHRGYAVQWFALALAVVAVFVVVNWPRPTRA